MHVRPVNASTRARVLDLEAADAHQRDAGEEEHEAAGEERVADPHRPPIRAGRARFLMCTDAEDDDRHEQEQSRARGARGT